MLFNYLLYLLLILLKFITAEHHRRAISNYDNIIPLSSVLGTSLLFNLERFERSTDNEHRRFISWYKGITNLKLLISNNISVSTQSRYSLLNQTNLLIKQTIKGDEGFYTLKIQTKSNLPKDYFCHVSSYSFPICTLS